MALFTIDGVAVDRIHKALGIDPTTGEIIYVLTQLTEATLEITAESKDMVDKDGTLIKKIYTGKTGTFSATNAFLDANIIAQASGSKKEVATAAAKIKAPVVHDVKNTPDNTSVVIDGLIEDTVKIIGESASGALIDTYTLGTIASATEFVVANDRVTLPVGVDSQVAKFVIIGEREMSEGAKVVNMSDQFPETITLLLQCITIDPCTPNVRRATYIKIPSFQPSPDLTFTLSTDAQLDYTGDIQTAYCAEGGEKVMFECYFPGDDTFE